MTGRLGRTSRIEVRLTPSEESRIRARAEASGLSLSAFIRRAALSGDAPTFAADTRVLMPLYTELRRCGNNANQLARAFNSRKANDVAVNAATSALNELERATRRIADELSRAKRQP